MIPTTMPATLPVFIDWLPLGGVVVKVVFEFLIEVLVVVEATETVVVTVPAILMQNVD